MYQAESQTFDTIGREWKQAGSKVHVGIVSQQILDCAKTGRILPALEQMYLSLVRLRKSGERVEQVDRAVVFGFTHYSRRAAFIDAQLRHRPVEASLGTGQ